MRKILLLLSILLTLHTAIWAQAMTNWNWSQYGLSFDAPSNLKIQTNNATDFVAKSSMLTISINVMDYTGITLEEMAGELGSFAEEIGMAADSEVGPLRLTTLVGVYIDGTLGNKNALLAILADEESNIAVAVAIEYDDEEYELPTKILNSFSIK